MEETHTKVLVADDQPAMRKLIADRLRDAGYDVVEVSDGKVLWDELNAPLRDEDNPRPADLIVSDIRMPDCSGLEVLSLIRGKSWQLPVILMTAFGDSATHAEAYRLGAAKVFDKPFNVNDLVSEALRLVQPE